MKPRTRVCTVLEIWLEKKNGFGIFSRCITVEKRGTAVKNQTRPEKTGRLFVLSMFISSQLIAANTFTLRSGVTDWTLPGSYVENAKPAENAIVHLPVNCTVTLDSTDSESWTLAESFERIIPADSTSRLVVNVSSGEASLTVPFSSSNVKDVGFENGVLEKTGDGNLFLGGAEGRFYSSAASSTERYDYYTSLVVSGGILTLPQNVTVAGQHRYGHVTIGESATLVNITVHPDLVKTIWPSILLNSLSGRGTLTSTGERPVQVSGTSVFEGKLSGILNLYVNGWMTLLGSGSDTTGKITLRQNYENFLSVAAPGGILYVNSIGMAGHPSPVGVADTIETGDFGGGFVYTGNGETCDKDLYIADSSDFHSPSFINGGPNGGLVWTGGWRQPDYNDKCTKARRLMIMGTNRNECVMSGVIKDATDDGILFPINIIKRGSGTWRMAHNDNRTGGGVYSIEEGVLRYDSIAERGEPSALGASDNLVELDANYRGGRDIENHRAPYAFLLGSAKGATMEFTGENGGKCSTRPVAVKGKGRFKISGSGTYSFSGFSAETAGSELVVDTARTDGYVWLGGISDGKYPLAVTKEGLGEIKISGGIDFTGPLSVKEGTLALCATNRPYGWFRWIVKEKGIFCDRYKEIAATGWPNTPDLKMEEFALFDAEGKRIDKGLSYHSGSTDLHSMPCGSVVEENGSIYETYGDNVIVDRSKIATLFDGGAGSKSGVWGGVNIRSGVWPFCRPDTPKYWFRIVERLPENSKPAASFDMAFFYGAESSNKGMVARAATAVAIEGSVDGVNWEPVAEDNALEIPAEGPRWYADANPGLVSVSGAEYALKDHVGFPMRGFSTNGVVSLDMPVKVAQGATLRSEGNVILRSLVLSKSGNGTIEGFAIPEEGSLAVEGEGMGSGIQSIPVDFRNCTGLKNVEKWELSINGGSSRARNIRVFDDGTIELVPPGLVVVIK